MDAAPSTAEADFGALLRRHRQAAGLTQEELHRVLAGGDPGAPFEVAEAADAEARARGQLLLRQTGRLPVPP